MISFDTNISRFLPHKNNWFGWASLLVTIVIAVFWMGNTPMDTDDFYYSHMPLDENGLNMWHYEGEEITSFSQIPQAVINHRANVNGRFSNMAFLAFQPLPLWFIKYFCGAMLALFAWSLWRWNGKNYLKNNWLAVAVPFLMWTGLQWNDQMQSSDFHFNYTIPSLLLIACLMVFGRHDSKPRWWGWLLLAFFSIWHECFTIALGVFLGVQWLFERRKTTFIAIVILIGGALFQFTGGSQERLSASAEAASLEFYPWTYLVSKAWVSFLAFGLWLWRRRKIPKEKRMAIDRFALGLLASWIVALSIILALNAPQRSHWAEDVMSICLILLIVNTFKPLRVRVWIGALLLAFYAAWGASLIYWQCRVTEFTNYCINEIKQGKTAILDKDGFASENIPFWLMGIPKLQYGSFSSWAHTTFAYCNSDRKTETYVILPKESFDKPIYEWEKIPGNNNFYYASPYCFVKPHDGFDPMDKDITLTFGKPTIAATPLDRLINLIMHGNEQFSKLPLGYRHYYSTEVNGDSIDVIFLCSLPRSFQGRPIVSIDLEP